MKTVLILGGSGSLGSALIEQLINEDVIIRVFARNEYLMFNLRQKYKAYEHKIRYLIGDIREKERLDIATQGVDIIINCAALKHVKMCTDNPMETIKTNVLGTQNAIDCAIKNNVELFIQISTDKAVNPVNIYGCSKAMAEHLVLEAHNIQGKNRTRFCVVRSGNILKSSGSVLEIWERQFKEGKPLTVTDLNATRYAASQEGIAKGILSIINRPEHGLFVLNMPKYSVKDLISKYGDYPIDIIGLQKGEKLEEELYRIGEKVTLIDVV